jgi:DNA-binding transcriptional LysR family regulator
LVDKFAAMRAFVEICDQGSLTAAGAALGKSQPTMVRLLANLEQALGARLLRRTTRRLALTEEGRGYLEQCRRILADVVAAERGVASGDSEPRGKLRITAPVTFGQRHLAPIAVAFLQRYAEVQLELLLLDRVVNMLEEGVDVALRIGSLGDSSMISTGVGVMRRVLVGSPALLAQSGTPVTPEDLKSQPAVIFRGVQSNESWAFHSEGRSQTVNVRPVFSTNQATPAVAACVQGIGLGIFLHYQVADQLARGELRLLLTEFEPHAVPVSLVYSDARLMSPSLRVLIDFLRTQLREVLSKVA